MLNFRYAAQDVIHNNMLMAFIVFCNLYVPTAEPERLYPQYTDFLEHFWWFEVFVPSPVCTS